MDFSKLTRAHVFIIGAVIAVILGVGFYFLGVHQTQDHLSQLDSRLETANGTIAKEAQYKKDLEKAKGEVRDVQSSLVVFTKTKMPHPPIDLRNQDPKSQVLAMMNLWQEPKRLYYMAQGFALNTNEVAVRTQFGVPAQPSDPKLIPTTIIELPIGQVTAYGDLEAILRYMKRWNRFGRVVAVDNLVLDGTSPLLSGTAQLTVYIFPEVDPNQVQQTTDTSGYGGSGYGGYPGGPGGPYGPPGGPGGYGPPGGPGGYGPPGGPPGAPGGPK
jgi:hypothetical protein